MFPVSEAWTTMPWWAWAVLAVTAFLVGFSKTAIGNVGMLAVALAAWVLPTRDSTGVMLIMLIVGDIIAVSIYRHNVDWRLLARLIVPVLIGLGIGWFFLGHVDNVVLARTIGVILLGLLAVGLWGKKLKAQGTGMTYAYGGLTGFTAMVANAGGAPLSLYLLAAKFDKWRFLATNAWFFFLTNLVLKLPLSIGLGIIRPATALLAAVLIPVVVFGAWIGRILIKRANQQLFERLVTIFVAVAAVYLIIE